MSLVLKSCDTSTVKQQKEVLGVSAAATCAVIPGHECWGLGLDPQLEMDFMMGWCILFVHQLIPGTLLGVLVST